MAEVVQVVAAPAASRPSKWAKTGPRPALLLKRMFYHSLVCNTGESVIEVRHDITLGLEPIH